MVIEPSWSATAPSGVKLAVIKDCLKARNQAHRVQPEEIMIQGWCGEADGSLCVSRWLAAGGWEISRGEMRALEEDPRGKNVFLRTSSVHHFGILSCLPMALGSKSVGDSLEADDLVFLAWVLVSIP